MICSNLVELKELFITLLAVVDNSADSDAAASDAGDASDGIVRDANGNVLQDGDAVILVKDLKVKGSSTTLKKGTKIKSIRLVDGADGHNVDGKTDLGSLLLKSEFLKKA